jgi:hypothetical protein
MSVEGRKYAQRLRITPEDAEAGSLLLGDAQPFWDPIAIPETEQLTAHGYRRVAGAESLRQDLYRVLTPAMLAVQATIGRRNYECDLPIHTRWHQHMQTVAARNIIPLLSTEKRVTGKFSDFSLELIDPAELKSLTAFGALTPTSDSRQIQPETILPFKIHARHQSVGHVACGLSIYAFLEAKSRTPGMKIAGRLAPIPTERHKAAEAALTYSEIVSMMQQDLAQRLLPGDAGRGKRQR